MKTDVTYSRMISINKIIYSFNIDFNIHNIVKSRSSPFDGNDATIRNDNMITV